MKRLVALLVLTLGLATAAPASADPLAVDSGGGMDICVLNLICIT